MASMTFAQLKVEVFAAGFDYLNDGSTGDARVGRWINSAYTMLCAEEHWPFLETTTTGVAPITFTDLQDVMSVVDTTQQIKLRPSDYASLTDMFPDLTITGVPVYWYLTGSQVLNVFPASTTDSLSVRYWKIPALLSVAPDTTIVPETYQDLIVLGAMRRGYLDDGDQADYQLTAAEYQTRLTSMREDLVARQQFQQIVSGSGDW